VAEVAQALGKLKGGSACGPDGLPPDLFRFRCDTDWGAPAAAAVAGALAPLFNAVFDAGAAPDDWGQALLTLVHKGGAVLDWGNYRPIACMNTLAKVFAHVLNGRLTRWAEAEQKRSPFQAGFRPCRDAPMQMFVLQHLVDVHRKARRPLFACFVDFTKAFDSVPRDQLWQRLSSLGVQGRMLRAVQALYANTTFRVKIAGDLSAPFPVLRGVRQGCPLSPLLFGLYIEQFPELLAAAHPALGPLAGLDHGPRVPILLYADDAVLLASSQADLQTMLDALGAFCAASGMSVNLRKTRVVVFRSTLPTGRPVLAATLVYGGRAVEEAASYVYLGVEFAGTRGLPWTAGRQLARAVTSLQGVHAHLRAVGLKRQAKTLHLLFKSVVWPALGYGAEVWGVSQLGHLVNMAGAPLFTAPHAKFVLAFYRSLLGVGHGVAGWNIMREMGEYPVQQAFALRCANFYNRVLALPADALPRQVLLLNVSMAAAGQRSLWAGVAGAAFRALGCEEAGLVAHDGSAAYLHVPKLEFHLRARCHAVFRAVPAWPFVAETVGAKLSAYHNHFAAPLPPVGPRPPLPDGRARPDVLPGQLPWLPPPYLRTAQPYPLVTTMARFRLRCHSLAIETGARARPRVPRLQRVCQRCRPATPACQDAHGPACTIAACRLPGFIVDDERHALFDCAASAALRADPAHAALFAPASRRGLRAMCLDEDIFRPVARFLIALNIGCHDSRPG
jgi:hypothetical protein